ncbi:LuxR C-terminal-related transcriptional regulator [Actinoplanes sp. NPDC051513]|uniref:LuxR C-terminal-related transcriptional regulator n=1 Tax=Actinoplanes sp. NPDC051513 TaxID=3363908 RepID=UPI0037B20ED8
MSLLDLALQPGLPMSAALGDAVRSGLVTVLDGVASFVDPRSADAVLSASTHFERCAAHLRLASRPGAGPAERAHHMANATIEPDSRVAALLEEAAMQAPAKGEAAALLIRAAEASPAASDRARRLAEAARIKAQFTGSLEEVTALLARARRCDPLITSSLTAVLARSDLLLHTSGDIRGAHRLLVTGIRNHTGPVLAEAVQALLLVCVVGHDPAMWASFDEVLARHRATLPPALVAAAEGLARPGLTDTGALDRAIAALDERTDRATVMRVVMAAYTVDRLTGCRAALRRGAEGPETDQLTLIAMAALAVEELRGGHWDSARRLAGEAVQLSRRIRRPLQELPARYVQAYIHAARGEDEELARLDAWAYQGPVPRGANAARMMLAHATAVGALGRGDFDDAYAILLPVAAAFEPHDRYAPWMLLDFVEACLATGRPGRARDHVRAAAEAGVPQLSARYAFVHVGVAAMVGDASFETVLAGEAEAGTFHRARLELAHGSQLRRQRRARDARPVLARALDTFTRLGAARWAERARTELNATAATRGAERLTPQEQVVADLAAAGLTNREIAARLQVSHRTVGSHLARIFPKLEVSSRAALREALVRQG